MHIGTELLIHFLAVISCWFQPVGLACGHNREAHNNGGSEWSRAPRGPPPGNHCPPVPRISDSHCRVSGWSMRPAWGQRAHCNFLQGCQLRLGLNISSEEAGNWGEGKKTYNFEQSLSFSTISLLFNNLLPFQDDSLFVQRLWAVPCTLNSFNSYHHLCKLIFSIPIFKMRELSLKGVIKWRNGVPTL